MAEQDQVAEAEAEAAVGLDERVDRVVGVDHRDDHGDVEEVAVQVLAQQREPGLTRVAAVRLGHGAGGRRDPERPVVGLAVVVAGEPEQQQERQRRAPRRAATTRRAGSGRSARPPGRSPARRRASRTASGSCTPATK